MSSKKKPARGAQPAVTRAKTLEQQGHKDDGGKIRYSLIPRRALKEVARLFTFGGIKYAPNNHRLGIDFSRLADALERHYNEWLLGERDDVESRCHHLSAVIFNAMVLLEFELEGRKAEFDDLYHGPQDLPKIRKQIEALNRERTGVRVDAGGRKKPGASAKQSKAARRS